VMGEGALRAARPLEGPTFAPWRGRP
jgi:hypothetical protein